MLDSENGYIQLAAVPALAASATTGDAELMALFARRLVDPSQEMRDTVVLALRTVRFGGGGGGSRRTETEEEGGVLEASRVVIRFVQVERLWRPQEPSTAKLSVDGLVPDKSPFIFEY